MKKITITVLLVHVILYASLAQFPSRAPISKEFQNYLLEKKSGKWQTHTKDGYPLGGIPLVTDYCFDQYTSNKQTQFDPVYDLRTTGYLTPVKNQQTCGSCWAHATMGSIESQWKKLGLPDYDLSEENLIQCTGFTPGPCDGGNMNMAAAYFTRGSGPILEANAPYQNGTGTCVTSFNPIANVFEMRRVPNNINDLKQAILDHGAIYTNMRWEEAAYNPSNYTYYYSGTSGMNHLILLVGWNDNKVTAGGTGAWICRNSWGTSWGESGFFYISYNDAVVGTQNAYFPTRQDYIPNQKVYFYDNTGYQAGIGWSDGTDYGLVKYVATANQTINKLGTYVRSVNTTISFEVYDNFDGTTLSGLLGSIGNQVCNLPGYYTFDLSPAINLTSGNDFYIKVKYSCTGDNYPIPVECFTADWSNPTIETNKCYASSTGNNGTWNHIGTGNGNYDLCIKAYASPQTAGTLNCSNPVALTCGIPYSGNTNSGSSNVSTYGCVGWNMNAKEVVHTITTTATGDLVVTLRSATNDLSAFILGSCSETNCLAYTPGFTYANTQTVKYTNAPAGTYYIVVDGANGYNGDYILTATSYSGGACNTLNCAGATYINNNTTISGTTIGKPSRIRTYSCDSYEYTGSEDIYTFNHDYVGDISVSITGASSYMGAYLFNACDPLNCLGTSVTNAPAGTYYIVVDGINGVTGTYNLIAHYNQKQINCSESINISCGVPYNGTTVGQTNNVNNYPCVAWSESGPERVHVITTASTGDITATLSNISVDLEVLILGSCNEFDCKAYGNTTTTFANAPAGTYYIVVDGYNGAAGTYTLTVNCNGAGSPPTATTNAATSVTSTTATLNGVVNANNQTTTVSFEYGLTTSYGSTATATPASVTGNSNTNVSANITGLSANTTYHFRVIATNASGTTQGNDLTFTTSPTGTPPTATTNAATSVTSTTATLNGVVNANNQTTTVSFEYGLTTSYGSTATATPASVTGNSNTNVSANITGLSANTTYHFRVIATNASGTTQGNDMTFTTSGGTVTYCSAGSAQCDEYISGVVIGTINNTGTPCSAGGYADYSSLSTSIVAGSSQTITVTNGLGYAGDRCGIWVDWNNNGIFDVNETINVIGNPGPGPYTADITPPCGTNPGSKRLRVRILYNDTPNPCGNADWGEVEDYTINVIAPQEDISENFDLLTPPALPSNWAVVTNTVQWRTVAGGGMQPTAYSNPNMMITYYNSLYAKNDWFFTNSVYLFSNISYALTFYYKAPGWEGVGEKMKVTLNSSQSPTSIVATLWDNQNIIANDYTLAEIFFSPPTTGCYSLGWHAYSQADLDYIAIDNIALGIAERNNSITPNYDQINIFPNPTKGKVTINFAKAIHRTVIVYDLLGNEIINSNVNSGAFSFDLGNNNKGIYLIKIIENNETIVKKILLID